MGEQLSQEVKDERERCAKLCEAMIVGGRAWTDEQAVAAETLLTAADYIRHGTVLNVPTQERNKELVSKLEEEVRTAHRVASVGGDGAVTWQQFDKALKGLAALARLGLRDELDGRYNAEVVARNMLQDIDAVYGVAGTFTQQQLDDAATTVLALYFIRDREAAQQEIARLEAHVADLQSGMYINCVYCGFRYGPADKVPATMADALKEHIEQCPKHPMSHVSTLLHEAEQILHSLQCVHCKQNRASEGCGHFLCSVCYPNAILGLTPQP